MLVLALTLTSPADTTPGRLSGIITDSTGKPVVAAEVRVDSTQWRSVSENGGFTVPRLSPGRHLMVVRSPGYALDSLHFSLDPGESMALTAKLQKLATLSVVSVRANADTQVAKRPLPHDWMEGFAERQKAHTGGTFLDERTIDSKGAMRMTELLRSVPGVQLVPIASDIGGNDFKIVMRGTDTVAGESCPIQYYLDGHPFEESDDVDRLISPHQVAAMEIYSGASQVPEQFKGPHARCGVIVIWSTSAGSY